MSFTSFCKKTSKVPPKHNNISKLQRIKKDEEMDVSFSCKNLKSRLVFVISLITLAFMVSGCDPETLKKCRSYVGGYIELKGIELRSKDSEPYYDEYDFELSRCIIISHKSILPDRFYSMESTGKDGEVYDQLCIKHSDMSYNKIRSIGLVIDSTPVYIDCDFLSIDIWSDVDFDESHPAGRSLADIVRFMSWSPYKYIKSGYSEYYHYDKADVSAAFDRSMRVFINRDYFNSVTENCRYPVDHLVKDLTPEDMILLGYNIGFLGILYFEKEPDIKGEYYFTVSIKTDNDQVLKDTVNLIF